MLTGQEQGGPREEPQIGGLGEWRQREVVRPQGHADQRDGTDPSIVERRPERDAGPERPAGQEHPRVVAHAVAEVPDGRACVAELLATTAVRPRRSHGAAEVEAQDGQAPVGRQLVPDGPQDGVVLRPAVTGMRVTQDGAAAWGSVRQSKLALQADAVIGGEGHGLHPSGTIAARWTSANPAAPSPSLRAMIDPAGSLIGGTAFALRDPYPWNDLAGLVRAGESLGYRALFLPEVGARDTLAALTGLAEVTSSLLLGTGVVPLPSRSPALLAMAAATAQERSGGRLVLGLGTGRAVPGALDRLRRTVRGAPEGVRGQAGRDTRRNFLPARPRPGAASGDLDRGARPAGGSGSRARSPTG